MEYNCELTCDEAAHIMCNPDDNYRCNQSNEQCKIDCDIGNIDPPDGTSCTDELCEYLAKAECDGNNWSCSFDGHTCGVVCHDDKSSKYTDILSNWVYLLGIVIGIILIILIGYYIFRNKPKKEMESLY